MGLQGLTYVLPILIAAYAFGAALGLFASVVSLFVAHVILWIETPEVLFTRAYALGMFNYAFVSALIILYTYRHERVMVRLDRSLEGEKRAGAEAEEANRLKDEFLATLSHELRTPMNVILGYLRMLLDEQAPHPRKALEAVQRNAEQQARLIEDVLDVSRIANGRFEIRSTRVFPVTLMRDTIESLQPAIAAKRLSLACAISDHEDVVRRQILAADVLLGAILSGAIVSAQADRFARRLIRRAGRTGGSLLFLSGLGAAAIDMRGRARAWELFYQVDRSVDAAISRSHAVAIARTTSVSSRCFSRITCPAVVDSRRERAPRSITISQT